MRLAIVIVNYRTAGLVVDCLHSLCDQIDASRDCVIVVDNESGDGSIKIIANAITENKWDGCVTAIEAGRNGGFAAGNNVAIRQVLAGDDAFDYVMLLNPDTLVQEGAIKGLVQFLDDHQKVGIVGSQLENGDGDLESSARQYPSVMSELDSGARFGLLSKILKRWQVAMPIARQAHRCDWVSGAAMMVRREVFEQIGLMDENYFLYFEELDFCQRAGGTGWEIWLEPGSVITHLEGAATGIQSARKRRGQYWYDSRRRYFIKHHGVIRWLLADTLWAMGRGSLMLRRVLKLGGGVNNDPLYFTRDLIGGDLKALMNGEVFGIKGDGSLINLGVINHE